MLKFKRSLLMTALTCMVLAGVQTSCATKAGTGALVGGAGGAAVGGLIGSYSHRRAGEGALIGGAVGAIGGAIVGNEMDKQDREREYDSYTRDYDRNYDAYGHPRGTVYRTEVREYRVVSPPPPPPPPPGTVYEYRRYDNGYGGGYESETYRSRY